MSNADRLESLLSRLRDLESRVPCESERPILEVGVAALRDEVSRLAHSLHDLSYCTRSLRNGDALRRIAG